VVLNKSKKLILKPKFEIKNSYYAEQGFLINILKDAKRYLQGIMLKEVFYPLFK
jgi:hypothetical protein